LLYPTELRRRATSLMGTCAHTSRGECEIRLPPRVAAFRAAHDPRRSPRWARRHPQVPAHLARCAVALDVVACQAAGDEVLPAVDAAPGARQDVVDRRGGTPAVAAAVIVPSQHSASGDRLMPRRW